MDLEASEDQKFFQETTRRFLETECPLTTVRELADTADGFDRGWWKRGAELGWTSLLASEEHGGGSLSGAGLLDLVIVAEEFGRLVSPGPLVPTNVVAAAVSRSGSKAQQAEVLPGIISGDLVAAWAYTEPGGAWNDVALTATAADGGYVLNGTKARVEAGAQADWLLVTAASGGGLTQFLIPASTPGVTIAPTKSLDMVRRFATISFDGAKVPASAVLGTAGGAADDVEQQLRIALVLLCAEMVGATERVFEFTTEYAADRISFGRALNTYQALKHRFADMKMWIEASQGTVLAAARAVQAGDDDGAKLVSVAKAYLGDNLSETVQDCVQMHGGIGVTWEHDAHLYVRRVTVDRGVLGSPDDHRERIATLVGM